MESLTAGTGVAGGGNGYCPGVIGKRMSYYELTTYTYLFSSLASHGDIYATLAGRDVCGGHVVVGKIGATDDAELDDSIDN